jgi:3-oxoacyl-[acyl-carrier protein] reductase
MKLEGKKAIITGCSRGLGVVIAESMWREGADILLVARSGAALSDVRTRLSGGDSRQQAHTLSVDLSDRDSPNAILAKARHLWPKIDILVNNAGIMGPIGIVADNDWNAWRNTIQVNLLAPAELCKLSIEWMRETGGGSIINLSGGGATAPRPNFSAYATAKCGLVRFSETIAAEVGDLEIRVNCVAPGVMKTQMLQEVLCAGIERVGAAEYERVKKFADAGEADAIVAAELVVYLASEESAKISGKLISAVWDPWRQLHDHINDLWNTDVYTLRRIVPEERGKAWGSA